MVGRQREMRAGEIRDWGCDLGKAGEKLQGRAGSGDTAGPQRRRKEKRFLGTSGTLQKPVQMRKLGLPAQQAEGALCTGCQPPSPTTHSLNVVLSHNFSG